MTAFEKLDLDALKRAVVLEGVKVEAEVWLGEDAGAAACETSRLSV